MSRLKKILALVAVLATLTISTTSCHKEGCPNNLGQLDELPIQEVC